MKEIQVVTPQFDRIRELDFQWKPDSPMEFMGTVENAPWEILKGLGFGKWDKMSELVKENAAKPKHNQVSIPVINSNENFIVDIGHKNAPLETDIGEDWVLLFPHEWYGLIPDGFMVTGLNGERYAFKKGVSDDDKRFGCLPYGITRKIPD